MGNAPAAGTSSDPSFDLSYAKPEQPEGEFEATLGGITQVSGLYGPQVKIELDIDGYTEPLNVYVKIPLNKDGKFKMSGQLKEVHDSFAAVFGVKSLMDPSLPGQRGVFKFEPSYNQTPTSKVQQRRAKDSLIALGGDDQYMANTSDDLEDLPF